MQTLTLSTSPIRDRLAHLEQVYPKPSISSRETTLMFAQAVIAKEAAALDKLASTLDASFVHAVEAAHGDLGMITSRDVVLIISHSGETAEILNVLPALIQLGCPLIAITGRPRSRLARAATVHLDTGVREEADPRGLAPTTSATATLVLGDALALVLAEARHFTPDAFLKLHPGGSLGQRNAATAQVPA